MNSPLPHSFSRSPVEEVFCCCTRGPGAGELSLAIPVPYPGWPSIRDRIGDMIAGAGDVSRITGCLLRYTDLIPVADVGSLPGNGEIEQLLSGRYTCSFDRTRNEFVLDVTKIPDTAGSVRSIHNRPGKPGWTLIFAMRTDAPPRFATGEGVLGWFDDARAGIHELFDLVVPDEIIETLR